jgi:hypothetical protein
MKIHPLMLAAVVAFWGWQTGLWIVAVLIAIVLCSSFYISLRWTVTTARVTRVADFCTVLSLVLGAYLYLTHGNPRAIILFFQWLPVLFLPLALAHAYGSAQRMNLSTLFWSLRRRPPARPATFDPWWPYYALWIVAASAANGRDEWFYAGLVALVGWPLVRIRPWSYRVGTWGVTFSLAIGLGYGFHYGLNSAQVWLEAAVPEWVSASGSRTDPYRATTDLGHIGKLKESDAIVLRVTVPNATTDAKPPALLHRASYNSYFDAAWLARGVPFAPVASGRNNRWPLAADSADAARVTIHDYSARPNPVLSLPTGTVAIEELNAISAQRHALGAVQIAREPGYFSYTAVYAGEAALDGAPTAEDTRVPLKEREAFEALALEMGIKALVQKRPAAATDAVKQFFANGYRYATYQKSAPVLGSPIVDFLHRAKSGHCEYFATATVLLLRAGGIPARYATGFAVHEKSELENAYIVRARHAHAWARAWVNGAWIDIDTTPPSWLAVEAADSSAWSAITDGWSWAHFRAAQAWASSDRRQLLVRALMVMFPLVLWLTWRLYRSRHPVKNNQLKHILTSNLSAGADAGLYRIEQRLAHLGWGRRSHETNQDWLARLKRDAVDAPIDSALLAQVVALHNRQRFDPQGLDETQRAQLKVLTSQWLARHAAATAGRSGRGLRSSGFTRSEC